MPARALRQLDGLLRTRDHGHTRVTYVELFFDLVFVFAITQISHFLLHHLTPVGLAETAFLTLAMWSVWIYTSWATNWLDPQKTPVRILLLVLMLAGLIVSASIPDAFGERGLAFALAFAFMQVARTIFVALSLRGRDDANYRNFQRILCWLSLAAVLWIAGGFLQDEWRWAIWFAALALEFSGPAAAFWVPGMGRSQTTDWNVSADHFAERCALFVIIALGESLLLTGATFADLAWTPLHVSAFLVAFTGTVAMWWIYFSMAADDASAEFARAADPGRIARLAYTYMHIPLVAGIILAAVSDELILGHPEGRVGLMQAIAILGGPALFLLGNLLFKRVLFDEYLSSHVAGLALVLGMIVTIPLATPIALAGGATAVLLLVGVWENIYVANWKRKGDYAQKRRGEH